MKISFIESISKVSKSNVSQVFAVNDIISACSLFCWYDMKRRDDNWNKAESAAVKRPISCGQCRILDSRVHRSIFGHSLHRSWTAPCGLDIAPITIQLLHPILRAPSTLNHSQVCHRFIFLLVTGLQFTLYFVNNSINVLAFRFPQPKHTFFLPKQKQTRKTC